MEFYDFYELILGGINSHYYYKSFFYIFVPDFFPKYKSREKRGLIFPLT